MPPTRQLYFMNCHRMPICHVIRIWYLVVRKTTREPKSMSMVLIQYESRYTLKNAAVFPKYGCRRNRKSSSCYPTLYLIVHNIFRPSFIKNMYLFQRHPLVNNRHAPHIIPWYDYPWIKCVEIVFEAIVCMPRGGQYIQMHHFVNSRQSPHTFFQYMITHGHEMNMTMVAVSTADEKHVDMVGWFANCCVTRTRSDKYCKVFFILAL